MGTKKKRTVETIELTLSTDYVKDWTAEHGVREFVQNALDAKRTQGSNMSLVYDGDLRVLKIETIGQTLQLKTLLLGISEKGSSDAVGRFGEGYKVGSIALLREGKSIEIRTGTQLWRPKFARSERFGVPTLSFDIEEGYQDENVIRVLVSGVSKEDWDGYRKLFRITSDDSNHKTVNMLERYAWDPKNCEGTLLLDETERGRIYVGGIFVTSQELGFGYDLPPALFELDRDRSSVRQYQLEAATTILWQSLFVQAFEREDELWIEKTWRFIGSSETKDGKMFDFDGTGTDMCPKFKDTMLKYFKETHGENAYPVPTHSDAARAQLLGLSPVIVAERMSKLLAKSFPLLPEVEKKQQQSVLQSYSMDALTPREAVRMRWVWSLVKSAGANVFAAYPDVIVLEPQAADFVSSETYGCHSPETNQCYVARSMIMNFGKLMVTLVHEFLHFANQQHGTKMDHATEWMYQHIFNELAKDEDPEPDPALEAPIPPDHGNDDLPF